MKYIFIHGLGQNSSSWNKTISFINKPVDILCPDLFFLINNKKINYENLYNEFSNYCKDISEPLNLCGLSLGGIIAINYAIDYPERVKSLVLINSQYKTPKMLIKLQNIVFHCIPKKNFKNLGIKKKDFIQLINSMTDLDFSKQINNILCNTLIICGRKDYINKKSSKNLSNNIPNSQLQFVENSKHEINVDNPKELALKIKMFYENL